jgi:tripartite ATP-independent transporter DctP family solute receptor
MEMKRLLLATVAAGTLAAPALVQAADQVMKYAHFQAASLESPKHAAALAFKGCFEGKTGGAVEVQIFPASQLGDGPEVLEGLQLGTIQLGVVHDGPISAVYPPFAAFAVPYLFEDQAEAWAVVDGPFGQEMGEDMAETTGIRMLAMADNGVRNFTNSKRPVQTPEDMAGLKIRVMTAPVWVRLVESLGASATPVPWPELPGALQQGVVDGQENGVTNILDASLYQHQDYVTLDGHVFSWHAYLINEDFYQGLSEDQRAALGQCTEIAKVIHRGMTAAQDTNATTILGERGMEVVPLTPEQKAAFREKAQPAVREWVVEDIGAEWPDKLDAAIEEYRAPS